MVCLWPPCDLGFRLKTLQFGLCCRNVALSTFTAFVGRLRVFADGSASPLQIKGNRGNLLETKAITGRFLLQHPLRDGFSRAAGTTQPVGACTLTGSCIVHYNVDRVSFSVHDNLQVSSGWLLLMTWAFLLLPDKKEWEERITNKSSWVQRLHRVHDLGAFTWLKWLMCDLVFK